MSQFTFIDLFAGIGGFRQALESLGGRCLGFSEIYKDAISAYCQNYGETESDNFGDITQIKDLPEHDFMTAGVPCQSWSIAGKNLGFDDDRGQLWNDTLFLLNKVRPKAFIFENVKGLADPRNREALEYILNRIAQAGYYAKPCVLNAHDYGVPQTRVRIYIVGFREKKFFNKFCIPEPLPYKPCLRDVLDGCVKTVVSERCGAKPRWSLSCSANGLNDYFLFNDLRNGDTTIHTWDITETTERQKQICYLLLRNRRKRLYGSLDGNPLSIEHFQDLDSSITKAELEELVELGILKLVKYAFRIVDGANVPISESQKVVIRLFNNGYINVDELRTNRTTKLHRISAANALSELESMGVVRCVEERYDFRNTKISTGLNGVNRIFLPSSSIYPTLVASDTNDFVTTMDIAGEKTPSEFKRRFIEEVYEKRKFRKISKAEACRIQGFPTDFVLPTARARWMHLIGNSVSVPVVCQLAKAIIATGVFDNSEVPPILRQKERGFAPILRQNQESFAPILQQMSRKVAIFADVNK